MGEVYFGILLQIWLVSIEVFWRFKSYLMLGFLRYLNYSWSVFNFIFIAGGKCDKRYGRLVGLRSGSSVSVVNLNLMLLGVTVITRKMFRSFCSSCVLFGSGSSHCVVLVCSEIT